MCAFLLSIGKAASTVIGSAVHTNHNYVLLADFYQYSQFLYHLVTSCVRPLTSHSRVQNHVKLDKRAFAISGPH